jgi:queuine/archaeosine tRNA-ribosyltransferase
MDFYTDTLFFPAISIATHTQLLKENWKVKNKSPRFYLTSVAEETQLFRHPYILTSAGHNYKKMDFMKTLGINDIKKDVNQIFGDSGGFQIATGSLANTDEIINKLYSWLEVNSTLAPVIDVPPWNSNLDAVVTKQDTEKSLKLTKYNIEKLLSRKKSDVLWLNASHCREYDDRMTWFNEVKDYNLDGWALGSISKNFYVILSAFATMIDSKELANTKRCQHIHFFGITATRYMPIIIYIKHKLNKLGYKINVSFDSSYATQNGGYGKYLMFPSATGFCSYHLSNKYLNKYQDVALPCDCPVCSDIRLKDILNENALRSVGQSYYYNVVQSHNVYLLLQYVKTLHSLIYTDCPELMSTAFKSGQLAIFKIIDEMFDTTKKTAYQIVTENETILHKIEEAQKTDEEKAEEALKNAAHLEDCFKGIIE